MNDLISRQAAVDVIRKCNVKEVTPAYMLIDKTEAMMELMTLPSAEPERKKGKWIDSRDVCWLCSECGKWLDVLQGDVDMNFCPNCGSRNIEEGEQSETD